MQNLNQIKRILKFGIVCGVFSINLAISSCEDEKAKEKVIEISTSGCYKSCPILDLRFNENTIYINWIKHGKKSGFYVYNPTDGELAKLDILFSKLDLGSLKEEYVSKRNDMQVYSTSIWNGSVKKDILFYEGESPKNYEELVDFLIDLGEKAIEKANISLSVKTRERVKILEVPTPPMPE